MKKLFAFLTSALLILPLYTAKAQYSGTDPIGTISYALPQTVIRIEVEAVVERFHAGPYARYAMKYLGVEARQEDGVTAAVTSVRLSPLIEADQSKRYVVTPGTGSASFLALCSQGLVSMGGDLADDTRWTFANETRGDFSGKGVSSNLTYESATLYQKSRNESAGVAVQQEMVVSKSLDQKAKEASDMVFNLRKKKIGIVTGDTDATYSGEAMGAAIGEIDRLEQEYLSLFLGYSDCQSQRMNYDIVPSADNKNQLYVAFRVSDSDGLVPADDVTGRPYLIELIPHEIAAVANSASSARGNVAYYRIPAVCDVKLTYGGKVLLQSRIPVYQLGVESSYPLSVK